MIKVDFISSEQTRPLRHQVLWPHIELEKDCIIDIDDREDVFHVGLSENDKIMSIATLTKDHHDQFETKNQYRLRAMATDSTARGKNFGEQVVRFATDELKKKNIDLLWCDAREKALGFYEKIGFTITGDYYNVRNIGPHKLAYKILNVEL